MTDDKIDVLVVDDSQVARMLLVNLLESDPQLRVVDALDSGQAALDFLTVRKADVVLMDIQMPNLDGFETTRRIMETQPLPIVICTSTTDPKELATTFRAMEAGAVACLGKPVSPEHPDFDLLTKDLIETIKLMSEVKVVRRWPKSRANVMTPSSSATLSYPGREGISVIGIGASTGGPLVLQTILRSLPKDFGVPILVVQHIAQGFLPGLVEWLNETRTLHVQVAAHDEIPMGGHVYFAPDNLHLGISRSGRLRLVRATPENSLRPAVSYLFRSLAEALGANAVGVLLTGMGKDGASELKLMKDRGATTLVQDRDSSVVYGMPREAIELGGATQVLPAEKIADTLVAIVKRSQAAGGRLT